MENDIEDLESILADGNLKAKKKMTLAPIYEDEY